MGGGACRFRAKDSLKMQPPWTSHNLHQVASRMDQHRVSPGPGMLTLGAGHGLHEGKVGLQEGFEGRGHHQVILSTFREEVPGRVGSKARRIELFHFLKKPICLK